MKRCGYGLWAAALATTVACSGGGSERGKLRVGDEPGEAGGGAGVGGPSHAGAGGTSSEGELLRLRVEDVDQITLEVITLGCAGECKGVVAVASGGNPPYSFRWADGVETATRELCADADTSFEVTATDTAFRDDEFAYEAQTVSTTVTATVLDCGDAGGLAPTCDTGFKPGMYEGTFIRLRELAALLERRSHRARGRAPALHLRGHVRSVDGLAGRRLGERRAALARDVSAERTGHRHLGRPLGRTLKRSSSA